MAVTGQRSSSWPWWRAPGVSTIARLEQRLWKVRELPLLSTEYWRSLDLCPCFVISQINRQRRWICRGQANRTKVPLPLSLPLGRPLRQNQPLSPFFENGSAVLYLIRNVNMDFSFLDTALQLFIAGEILKISKDFSFFAEMQVIAIFTWSERNSGIPTRGLPRMDFQWNAL